jgi:antitoxin ParD1/3/4
MNTEKLSITLPADMAQRIRSRIESGSYGSNSEVIREAVRLLEEREHEREQRLGAIRAKLDEAAEDPVRIDAGEMRRHFANLAAEVEKNRLPTSRSIVTSTD